MASSSDQQEPAQQILNTNQVGSTDNESELQRHPNLISQVAGSPAAAKLPTHVCKLTNCLNRANPGLRPLLARQPFWKSKRLMAQIMSRIMKSTFPNHIFGLTHAGKQLEPARTVKAYSTTKGNLCTTARTSTIYLIP